MHENVKLEEAEYFMKLMRGTELDSAAFRHNLSAFLSSARSVLQYAKKEAETKPGGRAWYDSQMSSSPICQFFKDERDHNIHKKPTHPKALVSANLGSHIGIADAVKFEVHRDGQVIQRGERKDDLPGPFGEQLAANIREGAVRPLLDDEKGRPAEEIMALLRSEGLDEAGWRQK